MATSAIDWLFSEGSRTCERARPTAPAGKRPPFSSRSDCRSAKQQKQTASNQGAAAARSCRALIPRHRTRPLPAEDLALTAPGRASERVLEVELLIQPPCHTHTHTLMNIEIHKRKQWSEGGGDASLSPEEKLPDRRDEGVTPRQLFRHQSFPVDLRL